MLNHTYCTDVDEINTCAYEKYYPIIQFEDMMFLSTIYLSLIENWLEDNFIDYDIISYQQFTDTYNLKFIEHTDQDVIMIKSTITTDILYRVICSGYYAHTWYYQLRDHTIESKMIDLTDAEANDILAANENSQLLDKIQSAINDLRSSSLEQPTDTDKIFVKLYSVSPKTKSTSSIDLTASTAQQVLDLLRLSDRTANSLQCNIVKGIMLRRYDPLIDSDREFRLFVKGYNLRAISQYNCYEELYTDLDIRTKIYDLIINWWPTISKLLVHNKCTIDIVFMPDWSIKIIELNSFGPGLLAGSSLYNWLNDYDILHKSSKPDIRFVEKN